MIWLTFVFSVTSATMRIRAELRPGGLFGLGSLDWS